MTTRILGHTFVEMTADEREAFAGTVDGTLIAQGDDFVLLYNPETCTISEMIDSDAPTQRDWTPEEL